MASFVKLKIVDCRIVFHAGLRQPHAEDASGLMKGVLRALGAAVETYWPIERINDDGTGVITGGIQFSASDTRPETKPKEIPPEDGDYGVRAEEGFTQTLLRFNWAGGDSTNSSLPC